MSQFNSPGGGGGFVSPGGGSQGSPGGGASSRTPASQSVRPVTVAQVRKATQMHSDAEWVVDESPIGQISIVAELSEHKVYTTNRSFGLDDGTGMITAKMWMDTTEDQLDAVWRGIPPKKRGDSPVVFVRVTGNIKIHGDHKHIHASNIRLVKDYNEVYFHLLETISVNIILRKGLPPRPGQAPQQHQTGAAQGQSAYTIQSRPAVAQKYFSPMADEVVRYLSTAPPNPEGIHVGEVAKALNANAMELSDTVDQLIDEGHIFTTIDDSHIQLAT
ncbi:replication protein A subunit RPA32 [Mycena filopes]|nr:replication protein A subunit RPA32 [Mycena filopes]